MKTITIVADDRIGLLADITYILGKSKVNIESVDVAVVGGKAVINLTVNDEEPAKQALARNGYSVMESNVTVLKLEDKPGELAKITKMVSDAGVDIQNVHIISRDKTHTILALITDKTKKARELLKTYLMEDEVIG